MSTRIKGIVIKQTIAVVSIALATPLYAQIRAAGWQHLGSAHVDGRADHDRIQVGGGAFRMLQLGVTGGAIGIERLVVRFRNGGEEVLPVGGVIRSGGRSRDIPLRGGPRELRNVEIWYQKSAGNAGKPRVDLFGRQ